MHLHTHPHMHAHTAKTVKACVWGVGGWVGVCAYVCVHAWHTGHQRCVTHPAGGSMPLLVECASPVQPQHELLQAIVPKWKGLARDD